MYKVLTSVVVLVSLFVLPQNVRADGSQTLKQTDVVRVKIGTTRFSGPYGVAVPNIFLFKVDADGTISAVGYELKSDLSNLKFVPDVKKDDKMWAEIWMYDDKVSLIKVHIHDASDIN